jgi:two-component system cell cycle sensor histidine kinase/response regulator CckA
LRVGHRRPELKLTKLDLNSFIVGYIGELRGIVGEGIEVDLDLNGSPLEIEGNREALDDIFCRIGRNLRSFVPTGTKVVIHTEYVGGEALLTVSDEGPGIVEEIADRVFDPFFTGSDDPAALGLGLPVVRGLVQSMNGSIAILPAGDSGTCLMIAIPAIPNGSEEKTIPSTPMLKLEPLWSPPTDESDDDTIDQDTKNQPPIAEITENMEKISSVAEITALPTQKIPMPKGSETILVVEDEPMVRELVTRSLSYLGYTVIKAENGQEGYELAKREEKNIDLIFSDIVMPKVSGPEMVHRLRSENVQLKVLFTTGFTENKRILENGEIREGINLLPKPYTTRILAERIRQALDTVDIGSV